MMKKLQKALLISAMLAVPFAAAQAHDTAAGHAAWIKAQKIDVQPTLKVTETQIPADSTTGTTGTSTPATTMPSSQMPSSQAPSTQMPSTQSPGYPPANSGMGTKTQ